MRALSTEIGVSSAALCYVWCQFHCMMRCLMPRHTILLSLLCNPCGNLHCANTVPHVVVPACLHSQRADAEDIIPVTHITRFSEMFHRVLFSFLIVTGIAFSRTQALILSINYRVHTNMCRVLNEIVSTWCTSNTLRKIFFRL